MQLWRNDTLLANSVKNQDKAFIQTATSKVLDRNGPALWLCMERVAPTHMDKLVFFLFPTMNGSLDASKTTSMVLTAVSECELTLLIKLLFLLICQLHSTTKLNMIKIQKLVFNYKTQS